MKLYLILSIVFIGLICQNTVSQENLPAYPTYQEVVNQFFTRYTTEGVIGENQFTVAKKPDGWHIMIREYSTNKIVKDELFWSRSKKEFLELTFPYYVQASVDPNFQQSLDNSWAKTISTLVPYWGYDGWEKDVMDEFGKVKNPSDSLLNALARAYSSYARNLISRSEFGNPLIYEQLPKGQNALKPDLLEQYIKYQHLAIKTYHKLYKQNPKFETFVADAFNVYSNEVMNAFLSLRFTQNEETAQKELKKGLYDDFYLEMARNYLNACDKDAILFTNGDMDTYPLLYVQEKENFRNDVLVVNLSLLNLGRYINHLTCIESGAKPLRLSMDNDIYKNETKPYFYVIEKLNNPVLFSEVVNFIQSNDSATKIQISENQFIDYIPSKTLYFKIDSLNIGNEYKNSIDLIDSAMFIVLSKNYLLVSEYCMIDILSTNNFERPVYFASTVYSGSFKSIENYLSFEGMIYKVGPVRNEVLENNGNGIIYPDILHDKLVNKFKFEQKNYKNVNASKQNILNTYYIIFTRLADSYLNAGNPEKALQVMDYFCQKFSPEVVNYNYYMYPLITNYFRAGKAEKAIELLKICVNSCKATIESQVNTMNHEKNTGKLAISILSLKELLNISNTYIPGDNLINEISVLIEKYEKNQD